MGKEWSLSKLRELVHSILSKSTRTTKRIDELREIIHYQDVLFYTWQMMSKILPADKNSDNIYMLNAIELLEITVPPKNENSDGELMGFNNDKKFVLDKAQLGKMMGKVWRALINRDMTPVIHQKLLLLLLESYLSKIDKPIFLTDFFMTSMNVNGIIAVLALEGVSQLMQKHNIEYPNIYGKLYSMLEPEVFHKKFKSRLFYLADIFLSSIYLPESIVASFAKRSARLSLRCAACDIPMLLRFIGNLLIRHPGLKKMIHHSEDLEVPNDPFIENESDPTKTCASQSSLWEIALLKNHSLPSISSGAKFIDSNLPSVEFDLSEVLGKTYEDIFNAERKKKKGEKPSLTFERPQEIGKLKDDKLYKLWQLTT
ncbi:hypothetical protein RUM44_012526 [Polyplax serrata]|uniref:CCAAT-binding factor domain-containing protein n=1 Tax=Polyplax serrata TaxID=468196 RepID=A0ABR1BFC7_POLSC